MIFSSAEFYPYVTLAIPIETIFDMFMNKYGKIKYIPYILVQELKCIFIYDMVLV